MKKSKLLWVLLAVMALSATLPLFRPQEETTTYSNFLALVEGGSVSSVTIDGNHIAVFLSSGAKLQTYAPDDPGLIATLKSRGIVIAAKEEKSDGNTGMMALMVVGNILFPLIFIAFLARTMKGSMNRFNLFTKSPAKTLGREDVKTAFADIAGCDEAKAELEEVVAFLKDPKKFARLGGKIPAGVLLVGPPGTGKTLLGKAVAGEAGVPFFSIAGSEFVELFVGVGASRVRSLFEEAQKAAPCIIFIDEVDAVGGMRGLGAIAGESERGSTLQQLLTELDGMASREGVIVLAATNRPEVLDPALLRPGRFDRRVMVPLPDQAGRAAIFRIHTRKVPLAEGVNFEMLAKLSLGLSGADIGNIVNEAAILAAREGRESVAMSDLERARDKVALGPERRSLIVDAETRRMVAFHESGHALVTLLTDDADDLRQITIVPRGTSLGLNDLAEKERYLVTKKHALAMIDCLLGGRAAEEIVFQTQTTGAANDLKGATDIARHMVEVWGMSDAGLLSYSAEGAFLKTGLVRDDAWAPSTHHLLDVAERDLVAERYQRVKGLLETNREKLKALAEALLERETLSGADARQIVGVTDATQTFGNL
ncbi:MAG: ATP-dependent zinc metalloprotease FtsH [Patescibacteria group bacterium]